jgi:hypothetical protein
MFPTLVTWPPMGVTAPAPARGRIEIMEGEAALFRAFSDISIEVKNAIEAGGLEIAEVVRARRTMGRLTSESARSHRLVVVSMCRWSGRSI